MDIHTYRNLHSAADRLALEAARKSVTGNEGELYMRVYKVAMDFLIKEFATNSLEYFTKESNKID